MRLRLLRVDDMRHFHRPLSAADNAAAESIPSTSVPSLASARFFPGQFVPALPANSSRAFPLAITLDIDLFIIRTRQKDQYELALERIIFPGQTLPSAEYLSGN